MSPRRLAADHWLAVGAELGEGPFWDGRTQQLGFVDIVAGRFHTTDGTLVQTVAQIDGPLGAVLPSERQGEHLLVTQAGFTILTADGHQTELLAPIVNRPDLRFNDAKCDPSGRCWAGTLSLEDEPGQGILFRLDDGPRAEPMVTAVGLSNGLGWSPDGRTMYYADTTVGRVDRYLYDPDTATLGDWNAYVSVDSPDGLCVDDDGAVWVALWGEGVIHRYTPDGRLDTIVDLPVPHATSCAFYKGLLVITTARATRPDGTAAAAFAGDLFAVDVGTGAPPAVRWNPVVAL